MTNLKNREILFQKIFTLEVINERWYDINDLSRMFKCLKRQIPYILRILDVSFKVKKVRKHNCTFTFYKFEGDINED